MTYSKTKLSFFGFLSNYQDMTFFTIIIIDMISLRFVDNKLK